MTWDIVATGTFGGRLTDRAHCQAVFAQHNLEVQETIAPERLLVFEVKQGWEPLCAFLGVPVPDDEPFPHVNDTVQYHSEPGRFRLTEEEQREMRERARRALET